jgi:hypothetical protein
MERRTQNIVLQKDSAENPGFFPLFSFAVQNDKKRFSLRK